MPNNKTNYLRIYMNILQKFLTSCLVIKVKLTAAECHIIFLYTYNTYAQNWTTRKRAQYRHITTSYHVSLASQSTYVN